MPLPVSQVCKQGNPVPAASPCTGEDSFLAADVGGTHARIGLVAPGLDGGPLRILAYRTYRCADHPHLEDVIRVFCDELDVKPRKLALACAGYVHAGSVINKNLVWPVHLQALKERLALDHVWFLNDLQALAYAVGDGATTNASVLKVSMAEHAQQGPVVVIGLGTGLGAAVWMPGAPPRVVATEAGHTQLAVRMGREQQLFAQWTQPDAHVPYETVLSGPGLHRIYTALCAIEDRYPVLHDPVAVMAAALDERDDLAHEALTLFCGWLGSFAADMAMLYGASGGVYLAGGFLSQMVEFMQRSPLVARFLDKGVMRPFLQSVPVRVLEHGRHGVIGAAAWHIDTHIATVVREQHRHGN